MKKSKRAILFLSLVGLVLVLFTVLWGQAIPKKSVDVVIFSCLIMISFVTLFVEHFFTKPSDVIASTVSILLLIGPINADLTDLGKWYHILIGYNLFMLVLSIIALYILEPESSPDSRKNRASKLIKDFVVFWGNGKFLFSMVFLIMAFYYIPQSSPKYNWIMAYFAVLVFVNPKRWIEKVVARTNESEALGEIIGVQSNNVFMVKLYKDKKVDRFEFVEFKYSVLNDDKVLKGLVIDSYLMDRQEWVKILWIKKHQNYFGDRIFNTIDGSNRIYLIRTDNGQRFLDQFVGVVVENSDIAKIRFDYNSSTTITEGTLLQVEINNIQVLYQVINAITKVENLDNKNENSRVVGEAVQLGSWSSERCCFEKFGWVPKVNTPVVLAQNLDTIPEVISPEVQVGVLPSTNYPVILNTDLAITHHTAILGVTGCGKSTFARFLIREIANNNKIICIDFTGEYHRLFNDRSITLISEQTRNEIGAKLVQRKNTSNANTKANLNREMNELFKAQFEIFMASQESIAIFELPGLSNTTYILEYTQQFFEALFLFAQSGLRTKICVVLEEAHTIVPETNNLGDLGDYSSNKAVVNKIGQIALQGRKYGIGFLVIAQRTANVSKTVLTQCNTIISFQAFDKTSFGFLESYLGNDILEAMPNLKFRQAVMVGKAFRSTHPLIVEIPEIIENNAGNENDGLVEAAATSLS